MLPFFWIPTRFLVPQLGSGNMQAIGYTLYSAALEVGACSSVARFHSRGFFNLAVVIGATGYFFFLISAVFLIWGEFDQLLVHKIQSQVTATYIVGQFLILLSVAVERSPKAD
jgi:hypothetical protein